MRRQILTPFIILTLLGILITGCGSGKGGKNQGNLSPENQNTSSDNEPDQNTIDTEEAAKIKDAVMSEDLLNSDTLFEIPEDTGWSRGMEGTVTISKESYGEVSSEGSVTASITREASGNVQIDTDNDGTSDISKPVNISMTAIIEAKGDSEGGWQIVAISPTEIVTKGDDIEQTDFSIKWVKIMNGENWEVLSSDMLFKIPDDLPSFAPGSEITVEVAMDASVEVKVYLYHSDKIDPMLYDRAEEGYSIYSREYTVGPRKGEHIGAVEVVGKEGLLNPDAPFQAVAWLIGYIVQ